MYFKLLFIVLCGIIFIEQEHGEREGKLRIHGRYGNDGQPVQSICQIFD